MNRIRLKLGVVLALFFSLTACSPAKYNALLVGVWHGEKSNAYKMKVGIGRPDSTMKLISEQDLQEMKQFNREISRLKEQGATPEEISAPFQTAIAEYQSTYVFKSRGKGAWETLSGESGNGTWKLQRGGKLLILNDVINQKRVKLTIDSLSRHKMVISLPDLPGRIKLIYTKD